MKIFILIGVLLVSKLLSAQAFTVEGLVVDYETKQAIPNAHVFIDQSLSFTKTDSAGRYVLENIREKTFELVVAFRNYQTLTYRVTPVKENSSIKFELVKSTSPEIAFDQVSLNRWNVPFLVNLLGTSKNAAECELINPEALRFRFDEGASELFVSSIEPLQIINEGLGYMVWVQLDSFVIKPVENKSAYFGYSFFKSLSSKRPEVVEKWKQGRKKAFNGSLNHFFKSIYENTLNEEGWEVHAVKVLTEGNPELAALRKAKNFTVFSKSSIVEDGVTKDIFYLVDRSILHTDSLRMVEQDSKRCTYVYPGILQVIYKNEKEDLGYLLQASKASSGFQNTFLIARNKITIEASGKYFDRHDVGASGYMQWERLSELLPLEYSDR